MKGAPLQRSLPMWSRSFGYRDFRFLWVSILLQSAAMGMNWVVTGWLVFEISDSAFMVGVSSALGMAPFFFLGLVSGAAADRLDRNMLLRLVTLGGAATSGLTGVVLIVGVADLWHILALTAATGCMTAFMMTTRQSLTYDIVGSRLALNGMALNSVGMQTGLVIGSFVSGLLIAEFGAGGQYMFIGLAYVASIGFLMFIRPSSMRVDSRSQKSIGRILIEYVETMRRNRILVTLMALAGVTEVFGFTHMSLLPVIAKDVLGIGAVGLGVMTAARQIGGIGGLLALSSIGDFRRKGLLMFTIVVTFGVSLMALVLSDNIVHYMAMLTLANMCAMSVDTLNMTLMQENVPDDQRGRAMGAWTLSIGVAPVGHLGLGALAGVVGAPWTLFASGSVLVVAGLGSAIGLPRIRRLE